MTDEKMMLTVKEAAEYCSVNVETIRRWIRTGRVSATIKSRKDGYYIPKIDLDEHRTEEIHNISALRNDFLTKQKLELLEYKEQLERELCRVNVVLNSFPK